MKENLLKKYLFDFSKINLMVILIFFAISCQKKHDSSNRLGFAKSDFPNATLLNGKKYNLDFIINPAQILIKDSLLLIAERKSNENNKIHILKKENKELVKDVGVDGVGPGEITMGYPILDNGLKNEFWVYDGQQLKFSKFFVFDSSKLASHQVKGLDIPGYITFSPLEKSP
jgi:hypothetical protein